MYNKEWILLYQFSFRIYIQNIREISVITLMNAAMHSLANITGKENESVLIMRKTNRK